MVTFTDHQRGAGTVTLCTENNKTVAVHYRTNESGRQDSVHPVSEPHLLANSNWLSKVIAEDGTVGPVKQDHCGWPICKHFSLPVNRGQCPDLDIEYRDRSMCWFMGLDFVPLVGPKLLGRLHESRGDNWIRYNGATEETDMIAAGWSCGFDGGTK